MSSRLLDRSVDLRPAILGNVHNNRSARKVLGERKI